MRLRVGDTVKEKPIEKNAKSAVFEIPIGTASTKVMGEFLDASGKTITHAYDIYCGKVE